MPPKFIYFDLGKVLVDFSVERMCRQLGQVAGVDADRVAEVVFEGSYEEASRGATLTDPRYLYLLASLFLVFPVFLLHERWIRRIWLLGHAVVGGVWLGVQFSPVQVLAWLRLEASLDLLSLVGILATLVIVGLVVGPIYCGYLCPAGAVQELLGHLGLAGRLPPEVDRAARFIKYVVLTIVVVAAVGFGSESVLRADLLREVWATNRTVLGTVLLALIAGGSLLVVRFGCRYLCPTGAFFNLCNKVALLRPFLSAKRYPLCDLGVKSLADVDCLQCNRCLVGERVAAAESWHLGAFRLVLAAVLALLLLGTLPLGSATEQTSGAAPRITPVDTALIKAKIRAGRLSDKRAEYWHVVRD